MHMHQSKGRTFNTHYAYPAILLLLIACLCHLVRPVSDGKYFFIFIFKFYKLHYTGQTEMNEWCLPLHSKLYVFQFPHRTSVNTIIR